MKAVYIHIPFCKKICSYCDFCKVYYYKKWIKPYLISLQKEIRKRYQKEEIKTLYIGGGSPSSLTIKELVFLFKVIEDFNLSNDLEFTIECNIEDMNEDKLELFKQNKVNRLSFGVQSFNKKHLSFLGRTHTPEKVIKTINLAQKKGFKNINIDLIYGIPGQTLNDLLKDLKMVLILNITHLSCYCLMIEDNTELSIFKEIKEEEDLQAKMYKLISKTLSSNGFNQYEISNFSKKGFKSKHNLVYWSNEYYYGFGLGAVSFLNKKRLENTKSLTNYLQVKYLKEEINLSNQELMENEMILGLRKIKGVSKKEFYKKYQRNINDVFKIGFLIKEGNLIETKDSYYVPKRKMFLLNEILINFLN